MLLLLLLLLLIVIIIIIILIIKAQCVSRRRKQSGFMLDGQRRKDKKFPGLIQGGKLIKQKGTKGFLPVMPWVVGKEIAMTTIMIKKKKASMQ